MATRTPPKYRHYQPKNLAVVRIDGTDYYLGTFGSPESWEKYHRLLAERLAVKSDRLSAPRPAATSELTINELLNAYRVFAEGYYVKDGKPTQELSEMRWAAQPLRALYGHTRATEFGPLSLKAVREHMTSVQGLSRNVANHRIGRIKRIFKWGVSEELVPGSVLEALRSVDGLRYGRTNAHETEPVKPVEQSHVEAVLLSVAPQVAAMIQLQMLTAMRPGEVVVMRAADIDMTGEVWMYEPVTHKNRWRGHRRVIPIGPRAQEYLRPFILGRVPTHYLFSPREAENQRNAQRREHRKTPLTPSQRSRKPKQAPRRAKRTQYDVKSYRRAIAYGIKKANRNRDASDQIPAWYPLQLRHSRATEIRKRFGLEGAQVVLGHARADVTQVYAERNIESAINIAREVG